MDYAAVTALVSRIVAASSHHERKHDKHIDYGTAGFRTKADLLDHVMFRAGVVAALRSMEKNAKAVGAMITASHNPEEDNGVKLVDPEGEMLEMKWEQYATIIANTSNAEFPRLIEDCILINEIPLGMTSTVFIGRDTRKSSEALANSAMDGVRAVNAAGVVDFGVISTPMIHYLIACKNSDGFFGAPTIEGYYTKLSSAFNKIMGENSTNERYLPEVYLDGANGVGAKVIEKLQNLIPEEKLLIKMYNYGPPGILNHKCGADFVKVEQRGPENMPKTVGMRGVSLDGDADRVIYFYFDEDGTFHMLDGDKIALLIAEHLSGLIKKSSLNISLGIVQSAYANGSSTDYINCLEVPVTCVPTGVKHLHKAACNYDIGVYFEANGHGTVVFSLDAIETIKASTSESGQALANFMELINSFVGDAISDMLVVEAILHAKGWSIEDWDKMYTDFPNRQLKVEVEDRAMVTTTDAERKVVTPVGLQGEIDRLCFEYTKGRSFVRPSGTEDIVRVYAEADTQENADKLAKAVARAVHYFAGGIGPAPVV